MLPHKEKKDFSPKLIGTIIEDNSPYEFFNLLDWFLYKNCFAGLNKAVSFIFAFYSEYPNEIKRTLKFPNNFDLHKEIKELNYFIQWQKSAISQIPRRSDIKTHIEELIIPAENLFNLLQNTLPLITDEFNKIHDNAYPYRKFQDITLSTQKLEHELIKLKGICLSISNKVGDEFSANLVKNIDAMLACFRRGGATINGIINCVIPLESLASNNDFISSL